MPRSHSDPTRDFATDVVRQLSDAGFVALWNGGCVRDLMLGRTPKDYDVATDARPDQVRKVFGNRKTLAVGESFGVIIVLGPTKAAGQIEVATFRTEGPYADGRRPDSVAYATPQQDAQRRDFTINGMFYDPLSETVHDYVGGEQDLGEGIVRAIGDPHDRMTEDKLRMLRAVRFTATLDFRLDEPTADAVRQMGDQLLVVSWERISEELRKMLVDVHRERALRLSQDLGLLAIVFPELSDVLPARTAARGPAKISSTEASRREWWHMLHMLGNLEEPSFELAMAALLHSVPSPLDQPRKSAEQGRTVRSICRRLKLSNHETDHVCWLVGRLHALDDADSLPLSALKRLLTHPHIGDLLQLARRSALAEQRDVGGIDFAAEYLASTPLEVLNPPELIDGADLQALGLQPGPLFREILTAVRDAQLNEEIATREEALALARTMSA